MPSEPPRISVAFHGQSDHGFKKSSATDGTIFFSCTRNGKAAAMEIAFSDPRNDVTLTIGRDKSCHVVVDAQTDKGHLLSRHHCSVCFHRQSSNVEATVVDHGSLNGTFLDEGKVPSHGTKGPFSTTHLTLSFGSGKSVKAGQPLPPRTLLFELHINFLPAQLSQIAPEEKQTDSTPYSGAAQALTNPKQKKCGNVVPSFQTISDTPTPINIYSLPSHEEAYVVASVPSVLSVSVQEHYNPAFEKGAMATESRPMVEERQDRACVGETKETPSKSTIERKNSQWPSFTSLVAPSIQDAFRESSVVGVEESVEAGGHTHDDALLIPVEKTSFEQLLNAADVSAVYSFDKPQLLERKETNEKGERNDKLLFVISTPDELVSGQTQKKKEGEEMETSFCAPQDEIIVLSRGPNKVKRGDRPLQKSKRRRKEPPDAVTAFVAALQGGHIEQWSGTTDEENASAISAQDSKSQPIAAENGVLALGDGFASPVANDVLADDVSTDNNVLADNLLVDDVLADDVLLEKQVCSQDCEIKFQVGCERFPPNSGTQTTFPFSTIESKWRSKGDTGAAETFSQLTLVASQRSTCTPSLSQFRGVATEPVWRGTPFEGPRKSMGSPARDDGWTIIPSCSPSMSIAEPSPGHNSPAVEMPFGFESTVGQRLLPHQRRAVEFMWSRLCMEKPLAPRRENAGVTSLGASLTRCRTPQRITNEFDFGEREEMVKRKGDSSAEVRGCLLAHAMGMGKTLTVIAFLIEAWRRDDAMKPIVVAPKSAVGHWVREMFRWTSELDECLTLFVLSAESTTPKARLLQEWAETPRSALLLSDRMLVAILLSPLRRHVKTKQRSAPPAQEFQHTTDQSVRLVEEESGDALIRWCSCVVVDEVHRLQAPSSLFSVALSKLRESTQRIGLSGTPLGATRFEHREVAALTAFLAPSLMSRRYCSREQQMELLHSLTHRAELREMAWALPSLSFYDVYVTLSDTQRRSLSALMDHRKCYGMIPARQVMEFAANVISLTTHTDLVAASRRASKRGAWGAPCVAIANLPLDVKVRLHNPKVLILLLAVRTSMAQGEKVVVFSQMAAALPMVADALHVLLGIPTDQMKLMDGHTPFPSRAAAMTHFNDSASSLRVLLLARKAMGSGVSLIGASRVFLLDVGWREVGTLQAVFRVFRHGQTKPVGVVRLVGENEVEERVVQGKCTDIPLKDVTCVLEGGKELAESLSTTDKVLNALLQTEARNWISRIVSRSLLS